MKCPHCAAPSIVLSTRTDNSGQVRRRRKCTGKHQHRFSTVEAVVTKLPAKVGK